MSAGHLVPSGDLQWLLIKNGNSFTHKRQGADRIFSAEKGNVINIHAFKYSGLSNARTLDIAHSASKHGLTLTSRSAAASDRFSVSKGLVVKTIKGRSGRKAAGIIAAQSGSVDGRLDLLKLNLARSSALLRAQAGKAKAQKTRALRGQALVRSLSPKPVAYVKAPKAAKVETEIIEEEAEEEVPELVEA